MDYWEAVRRLQEKEEEERKKREALLSRGQLYANALPGTNPLDPKTGKQIEPKTTLKSIGLDTADFLQDFGKSAVTSVLNTPAMLSDAAVMVNQGIVDATESLGKKAGVKTPEFITALPKFQIAANKWGQHAGNIVTGGGLEAIKKQNEKNRNEMLSHSIGDSGSLLSVVPAALAQSVAESIGPEEAIAFSRGAKATGRALSGYKDAGKLIGKVVGDIVHPNPAIGRLDIGGKKTAAFQADQVAQARALAGVNAMKAREAADYADAAGVAKAFDDANEAQAAKEIADMLEASKRRDKLNLYGLTDSVLQQEEAALRASLDDPAKIMEELQALHAGKPPSTDQLYAMIDKHEGSSALAKRAAKGIEAMRARGARDAEIAAALRAEEVSTKIAQMSSKLEQDLGELSLKKERDAMVSTWVDTHPVSTGADLFESGDFSLHLDLDSGVIMEREPKLIRSMSDLIEEGTFPVEEATKHMRDAAGRPLRGGAAAARARVLARERANNPNLQAALAGELSEIPGIPMKLPDVSSSAIGDLDIPNTKIATQMVAGAEDASRDVIVAAVQSSIDTQANKVSGQLAEAIMTGKEGDPTALFESAMKAQLAAEQTAKETVGNAVRTIDQALEETSVVTTKREALEAIKARREKTDEVLKGLGKEDVATLTASKTAPVNVYDPDSVVEMHDRLLRIQETVVRMKVTEAKKLFKKLVKSGQIKEDLPIDQWLANNAKFAKEELDAQLKIAIAEVKGTSTGRVSARLKELGDELVTKHEINPVAFRADCG